MTQSPGEPAVLRDVWNTPEDDRAMSDDCSPTRVCRNARDFTFDGIAEEGEDLQTAWRRLLETEGKRSPDAQSVRDLVLGPPD